MQKLKFILPVALIALVFFTGCEQREDWRFPELGNGGFIKFIEEPFSFDGTDNSNGTTIVKYHIGEDPAESSFTAFVEDPNGNVASVDFFVSATYDDGNGDVTTEPRAWRQTTSFPFEVSFSTAEMVDFFGEVNEFNTGDFFEFTTVITTTDGRVYTSLESACEPCPTEIGEAAGWTGGTSEAVILSGGTENGLLPAIWYRVKYLAP
jgi:hypothetical protein